MSHATRRTKPVLGVLLAAVLALTAACGDDSDDSDKSSSEESSSQGAEGPNTDDIPDVVAEVNGEEVTKDEFVATYELAYQQATMQSQTTGQAPDEETIKKQTADELVDTELLLQEAESRDIAATDKDVDKRLKSLAKQNQMGSVDEFLAALKEQGSDEDFVREQVQIQVVVERLVKDETGPIKPTEAELRKIYNRAVKQAKQAAKQQGGQQQKIPAFAKARAQLAEQAKSDKQSKAAQSLVDTLRKDADINVHL